MSSITLPLVNGTLLGSDYSIYVMGFSSTSQKYLKVTSGTTAKFVKPTDPSGDLPAAKLGTEITEIFVDTTAAGPKTAADPVDGGRIYFFIAKNSEFSSPPTISYTNYCSSVVNVKNPPNTEVPPYTFAEFTFVNPSYGAVIDSQTVDGFVFPLTISVEDSSKNILGQVGQPPSMIRSSVIDAFDPFIKGLGNEGTAFSGLSYSTNQGGLLNPGAYLNEVNAQNEFQNLSSDLNTLFDADLNTLFSSTSLSIKGVSTDTIADDIYTSTSGQQNLPGSPFQHQALTLIGSTNNQSFQIFNPVGLCTLTSTVGSGQQEIRGTIDTSTLTFESPLASGTNIVDNMYVSGAGIPAGFIKVLAVNKATSGDISSLGLGVTFTDASSAAYAIMKSGDPAKTYTATLDSGTLTFSSPQTATDIAVGMDVTGSAILTGCTVGSVTTNGSGQVTAAVLAPNLGKPAPKSQYQFSKVKDFFLTSGCQAFGNFGVFAWAQGEVGDRQTILLALQNQIVTALNRGVALGTDGSTTAGHTTKYWGTQTNWYPANKAQNIFSLFMHTAKTSDKAQTPLFIQASNSTTCSRGTTMGQAYGFAYDENAGPVPPAPTGQPEVPSKFDPLPSNTATVTISLGPWLEAM